MSYKTPKALVDSPPAENDAEGADVERIEISDDDFGDGLNDSIDVTPLDGSMLALTWQGHSRADLQDLWRTAIDCRNAGKFDEAENMFHRVFLGMGHVLGRTNEDTVKVAYNLADLYADSDRMGQAIDMIEKVVQNHITTYGCEDSKTQQNILHAVELLNGWNRQADALGLLSLSRELLESSSTARNSWRADIQTNGKGKIARAGSQANGKGKTVQWSTPHGSQSDLSGVVQSVLEDSSPARIDFGLGVARTHIAVKDQATEGLLQAIISQCEGRPNLSVQHLKALAEILNLYNKLDLADENEAAFEGALESLERVWSAYEWEEDTIESLDFMEAKLQVVANVLKHGYQTQAKYLFREATDKATDVFGWDDERTVWVLITIGLVYQTHMTWADGEEFFEQAFSAALSNKDWGPKDGIVRSLQNAMDNHHFSYVSNEGRPFKSIFGVSGIKIMPGRLHLE